MGKAVVAVAAAMCWLAATPLQAQDSMDGPAPTASDDILDGALTCVAAYDTILASGEDNSDDSAIAGARAAAIDLYAQISGESSDEISRDIHQADADLSAELAGGDDGGSVEAYASTCDAAFMDVAGDDDNELIG